MVIDEKDDKLFGDGEATGEEKAINSRRGRGMLTHYRRQQAANVHLYRLLCLRHSIGE